MTYSKQISQPHFPRLIATLHQLLHKIDVVLYNIFPIFAFSTFGCRPHSHVFAALQMKCNKPSSLSLAAFLIFPQKVKLKSLTEVISLQSS